MATETDERVVLRYTDAIYEVIEAVHKELPETDLQHVVNALVNVLAHHLAGIKDEAALNGLFSVVGEQLLATIEEAKATGKHAGVTLLFRDRLQ